MNKINSINLKEAVFVDQVDLAEDYANAAVTV